MVFVVLFPTQYPEVPSSGEEHSTDKDGQDDLEMLSVGRKVWLENDAYQRLSPRWQMVHRFTVPCRRDVGDCQIRRHGQLALFDRPTAAVDTLTGGS